MEARPVNSNQRGSRAELLRLLQAELDLIEGGGYGQRSGQPRSERPMFDQSLICIDHWFVPGVDPGCQQECALMGFVPESQRNRRHPCHFIELNDAGDTVSSLEGDQEKLQREVKGWLRRTISRLQREEDSTGPSVNY